MAASISLDLRGKGTLSSDDSMRLDSIEPGVRREYNQIIGELIEQNSLHDLELLLKPSCRNTLLSSVHQTLCRIALVDDLLKHGEIPASILVEDRVIAVLIKDLFIARGYVCPDIVITKKKCDALRVVRNILFSIYQTISDWLGSRWFLPVKKPMEPILYIDNFLFPDSLDKLGNFADRYFSGHERFLSQDEVDKEWFAPTLVGVRHLWDYRWLGKRLKISKRNFLIQEAWLGFNDYLYCLIRSFLIPFRVKCFPGFRGVDLKPLFKQELRSEIASPSLVKAIYRYRFIRKLSLRGVDICGAVDWHENQVVDRALNLGFRRFYPKVKVKGYQGYVAMGYYAGLQPTCYELAKDTLPHQLHVISEGCRTSRLNECSELEVFVSPAFRFEHLFYMKDLRDRQKPQILIALPILKDESEHLLKACLTLVEEMAERVKFKVKPHPFFQDRPLRNLFPSISTEKFEQTSESIPDLLEQCSLVVSSGSSVCLEAVTVGIPVAIYGNRSGVTMNPIPGRVSKDLWVIFYTSNQLMKFAQYALKQTSRISSVHSLFHPIDREGARQLFACHDE